MKIGSTELRFFNSENSKILKILIQTKKNLFPFLREGCGKVKLSSLGSLNWRHEQQFGKAGKGAVLEHGNHAP
ncbi:hypothetical protein [Adhaeribacter soli]|uniref:hypothetical protein n=1 Tax=Adhaeribacter soli TaxID=2607655 RepID=UPI001786AC92|nr:hypothetical protein [Adhaeribacter soli]